MERTNADRATDGAKAVAIHNTDENDVQTGLVDLLADLMHYASEEQGLDFEAALDTARMHFQAEVDEEAADDEN